MSRDDQSPDEDEAGEPTLADRVEASDDFGAALQQSTGLVVQYRRIVLVLVIAGLLVAGIVIGYSYFLG